MLAEIFAHHIIDHPLFSFMIAGVSVTVTKHMFMMWIVSAVLCVGIPLIYRVNISAFALPRAALESVVVFIRDEIVIDNLGEKNRGFTPYFCTLFSFILLCNLLGLVPFGATATGNIAVTTGLALTTFLLINFAGIREQGLLHYIKSLVPGGVPAALYPFMLLIEIVGLFTKSVALSVRLFANMIAGHFVLLALIGLIFIFGKVSVYADVFITIPFEVPMAIFITLLEIFTAFLQAYIFTFLTAIFTGAALHPH